MELTILIPVQNEEANLRPLVESVLTQRDRLPEFEFLFVDDGSKDGTSAELAKLAADHPNLRYLSLQQPERGATVGRAIRRGLREARGQNVVIMDGDLTHDPLRIQDLLTALQDADLVIGSRYISPNGVREHTIKSIASRAINRLCRVWLGLPIHDYTHGYRALRSGIVPSLALRAKGFPIYFEISLRCFLAGYRLAEVPVTNRARVAHKSKFNSGTAFFEYLGFMSRVFLPAFFQRKRRPPSTLKGNAG